MCAGLQEGGGGSGGRGGGACDRAAEAGGDPGRAAPGLQHPQQHAHAAGGAHQPVVSPATLPHLLHSFHQVIKHTLCSPGGHATNAEVLQLCVLFDWHCFKLESPSLKKRDNCNGHKTH